MKYTASCDCGRIDITVDFPHAIETYQPRACDCDFCMARGLAYLSDPDGTLSFAPKDGMRQLKQGSQQASFWQCEHCNQVLVVTHEEEGVLRGAVSKALFEKTYELAPAVWVSPKQFSPKEKTQRWSAVWSKVI